MTTEMKPYEHGEAIEKGKLFTFDMEISTYPDKRMRTIRVWLPEDYDGVKRFPVVYMHDGQQLFRGLDDAPKQDLDRAVTSLAPYGISAIVVGIDNAENRGTELTPPGPRAPEGSVVNGFPVPIIPGESTTPVYAEFIVKYLKPYIDEHFMTLPDADNTVVGGISAGGSTSYYMILNYPEVFGRAIVCSPGFPMFTLEGMLADLDAYDFSKLAGHRIAFYNGDESIDVTSLDHVLWVYRKFKEKGFDNRHVMYLLDTRQSHCDAAWGKYMPELLKFVLAGDNSERV